MTGCLRIIFPGKLQYEVCFIKKNLVGEERRAVGAHIDADCLLDNFNHETWVGDNPED